MNTKQDQSSHLFLVRFWNEQSNDHTHKELRGRVQHVLSGEAHTFRDWQMLVELLREMAEAEGIEAELHGTQQGNPEV